MKVKALRGFMHGSSVRRGEIREFRKDVALEIINRGLGIAVIKEADPGNGSGRRTGGRTGRKKSASSSPAVRQRGASDSPKDDTA